MIRPARTSDATGIARVHVTSWRATYSGILPDDYLAALSADVQGERWTQILERQSRLNFVYVVEERGEVIGFASGGREREADAVYRGELYAIYLLDEHQRRGLGGQLLTMVADRLAEAGLTSMLVWVLVENRPARAFYERLGGIYVRSTCHDVGSIRREEASYGWLDTAVLRSPAQ